MIHCLCRPNASTRLLVKEEQPGRGGEGSQRRRVRERRGRTCIGERLSHQSNAQFQFQMRRLGEERVVWRRGWRGWRHGCSHTASASKSSSGESERPRAGQWWSGQLRGVRASHLERGREVDNQATGWILHWWEMTFTSPLHPPASLPSPPPPPSLLMSPNLHKPNDLRVESEEGIGEQVTAMDLTEECDLHKLLR
jgi:hypothetical protein